MSSMRSPIDIGIDLRTRDAHVRQYMGVRRFDVWLDGKCYGSFNDPMEAEICVRRVLDITDEEGAMLDVFVAQFARQEAN